MAYSSRSRGNRFRRRGRTGRSIRRQFGRSKRRFQPRRGSTRSGI